MKSINRIQTLLCCAVVFTSTFGMITSAQELTEPAKPAPQRAINPALSANLYQQLRTTEGNVFFSPYSISEAMGMVYAGSGGNTAKEIAKALSFGEDTKSLGSKMQELRRFLESEINIKDNKLNVANALCVTGEKPLQSYQDIVRKQYDGEVFTGGLEEINAWVVKKTEGHIEKIIDELSPDSTCVIINAVYFKGIWKTPFDGSATHKAKFHLPSGKDKLVDMMTRLGWFKVVRNRGMTAIELPYQTSASMVLIMPDRTEGMKELENNLNDEIIEDLCQKLQVSQHELAHFFMPKFKLSTSYHLSETMKKLGMNDAFDFKKADFKAKYGDQRVKISQIIHKATIEVDEKGTVATAAVEEEEEEESGPTPGIIRFDRPFIVLIRENKSGTNLFMGRINDPSVE